MEPTWRYGVIFKCSESMAEKIMALIEQNADLTYRRRCPCAKYLLIREVEKFKIGETNELSE